MLKASVNVFFTKCSNIGYQMKDLDEYFSMIASVVTFNVKVDISFTKLFSEIIQLEYL